MDDANKQAELIHKPERAADKTTLKEKAFP